jgi:hypothetical protein
VADTTIRCSLLGYGQRSILAGDGLSADDLKRRFLSGALSPRDVQGTFACRHILNLGGPLSIFASWPNFHEQSRLRQMRLNAMGTKMHRCSIILTSFLVLAATSAPAWAGWGCGSNAFLGGQYHTWNYPSKSAASAAVLGLCTKTQHQGCRVIDCRPNIDTEAQANALWPVTTANDLVRCGGNTGTKC